MRAAAFEVDVVLVVDLRRAVEAGAGGDAAGVENLAPFRVDQDAVGGDRATQHPVRFSAARNFS